MKNELRKFDKCLVFFGFVVLIPDLIPLRYYLRVITRPIFNENIVISGYNPTFNTIMSYVIAALIIWVFFRKLSIYDRLVLNYYNFILFLLGCIGSAIVIVTARPLYPIIPKLYLSVDLKLISYVSTISSICLYISCSRILLGIKPKSFND